MYSTASVRKPSMRSLRSGLSLALCCYPETLLKISVCPSWALRVSLRLSQCLLSSSSSLSPPSPSSLFPPPPCTSTLSSLIVPRSLVTSAATTPLPSAATLPPPAPASPARPLLCPPLLLRPPRPPLPRPPLLPSPPLLPVQATESNGVLPGTLILCICQTLPFPTSDSMSGPYFSILLIPRPFLAFTLGALFSPPLSLME